MPSPSALEQWATRELGDAAAVRESQLATQVARQAIPVVQQLLQDNIDAEEAAAEFAQIWKPHLRTKENNVAPDGLWRVICSAIEHFADDETGGSCKKLANLLLELYQIEERQENGAPVTLKGKEIFWTDLPRLNIVFYNQLNVLLIRGPYSNRPEDVLAWLRQFQNGALFLAHWLVLYGDSFPRCSPAAVALMQLREALERRPEDSPRDRRRVEVYVPAAVHWLTTAGAPLLQFCRDRYLGDGAPGEGRMDTDTGGPRFVGDDGFHMARWAVWKAMLRRVAAIEGIDPGVTAKAAKAADEMDRLELPPSEDDSSRDGGP